MATKKDLSREAETERLIGEGCMVRCANCLALYAVDPQLRREEYGARLAPPRTAGRFECPCCGSIVSTRPGEGTWEEV